MAHACVDCVNVHGDDPAEWLNQWPAGAEWDKHHKAYLCDGCAGERDDWNSVEHFDYQEDYDEPGAVQWDMLYEMSCF